MKIFFIVNPAAGQGRGTERRLRRIQDAARKTGIHPKVYLTKSAGDAERYAVTLPLRVRGEETRVYVLGGDGTVNEVINGLARIKDTESSPFSDSPSPLSVPSNFSLGIIPTGTGNDTVRNFFHRKNEKPRKMNTFRDISAQLAAHIEPIDLMQYSGVIDDRRQTRLAINMFNNGFDCNVVALAAKLKERPLVSGSAAYLLSVFETFARKKGIALSVSADGKLLNQGEILLCSVANGATCGGGIRSNPRADMQDGQLDLNIIHDVSRRQFIRLFPDFKKGKHLEMDLPPGILTTKKARQVRLEPFGVPAYTFCADGEIRRTRGLTITVRPGALNFLLPEEQ